MFCIVDAFMVTVPRGLRFCRHVNKRILAVLLFCGYCDTAMSVYHELSSFVVADAYMLSYLRLSVGRQFIVYDCICTSWFLFLLQLVLVLQSAELVSLCADLSIFSMIFICGCWGGEDCVVITYNAKTSAYATTICFGR